MYSVINKDDPSTQWVYRDLDQAIAPAKGFTEMYFPYSFVVVDERGNIIWES